MARKLKVWVDHHACVGNAMCESIAAKHSGSTMIGSLRWWIRQRHGGEDSRGGRELPGERDLRRGCGDGRAAVSVGGAGRAGIRRERGVVPLANSPSCLGPSQHQGDDRPGLMHSRRTAA